MFIITGGLHLWAADMRRQNRRPARRDGIANSSGDRPSMPDAVRIGAGLAQPIWRVANSQSAAADERSIVPGGP
jgi:hypothetical protein